MYICILYIDSIIYIINILYLNYIYNLLIFEIIMIDLLTKYFLKKCKRNLKNKYRFFNL